MAEELKSRERIHQDIEDSIHREFEIRNIIDTKIFTSIGVVISLITLILTQMSFPPMISIKNLFRSCPAVLFYLGLSIILFAIILLLFNITPKRYPSLDYSLLIKSKDKKYRIEELLIVLIDKKNVLLSDYQATNMQKSKALQLGVWFAVIGLLLVVISGFLA